MGWIDLREYEVALNSPTVWRNILWIIYGLYFMAFRNSIPVGHCYCPTHSFRSVLHFGRLDCFCSVPRNISSIQSMICSKNVYQ
jgi:hypothetical protein